MGPRLLYVEDDEDIRHAIAAALRMDGFFVNAVGTAEEAIEELRQTRYDVVLSDYRLPAHDAAWLLCRAKEEGLLEHTPALILTAEANPIGVDEYRVLRKPVDLDDLVDALASAMRRSREPFPGEASSESFDGGGMALTLYVMRGAPSSERALRNLRRLLKPLGADAVQLVVRDVGPTAQDPAAARTLEEDGVVVTPTLVRSHPLPRVFVIGDLSHAEAVKEIFVGSAYESQP